MRPWRDATEYKPTGGMVPWSSSSFNEAVA